MWARTLSPRLEGLASGFAFYTFLWPTENNSVWPASVWEMVRAASQGSWKKSSGGTHVTMSTAKRHLIIKKISASANPSIAITFQLGIFSFVCLYSFLLSSPWLIVFLSCLLFFI